VKSDLGARVLSITPSTFVLPQKASMTVSVRGNFDGLQQSSVFVLPGYSSNGASIEIILSSELRATRQQKAASATRRYINLGVVVLIIGLIMGNIGTLIRLVWANHTKADQATRLSDDETLCLNQPNALVDCTQILSKALAALQQLQQEISTQVSQQTAGE